MTAIDQGDLQGNILCGYGFEHALYAFLQVRERAAARGWLRDLLPALTTAEPWGAGRPDSTANLAVSARGLAALGMDREVLAGFPADFLEGMASRARMLSDTGPSAPERWETPLRGEAHVVLMLNARSESALARARDEHLASGALELVYEQPAAALAGAREHFGFRDGFAQPQIADRRAGPWVGSGTPRRFGWKALQPGEFVLGYPDEDGAPPAAPAEPYGRGGTFMVLRKLRQDVALWHRWMREWAGDEREERDALAAKIVGRWQDGRPLSLFPERVHDQPSADELRRTNRFRFRDDPEGLRCPLGAHIRRVNPRDAIGGDGRLSSRHRIIRRGMPYGPPADGDRPDDEDRGLVFVSFQASIERQFETIQARWCADGDPFGLGADADFLLADGDPDGKMTIPGDPPRYLHPQPSFVTTRGGGYYFVPGIGALAAMAGS